MFKHSIIAALLWAGMSTLAAAQSGSDTTTASVALMARAAGAAPLDHASSALQSIEVSTVQDNSNVSLRFGNVWSDVGSNFFATTFTISSPIDKNASETRIATLDGLRNATTFELALRGVHAGNRRVPARPDLETAPICQAVAAAAQPRIAAADIPKDCNRPFVEQHDPNGHFVDEYEAVFWYDVPMIAWGLNAKVGTQDFDFFNPTTLARQSDHETPWSVGGYVGLANVRDRTLMLLSVQAQTAYKDAKSNILCPGGTPPVQCVSGPIGAPKETDQRIVSLEYRRGFDNLGVSLTASYETEQDVWGLDLPIYLAQNDKQALTGGVRLGWRSDDHDVTLGVFVGKAFDLSF